MKSEDYSEEELEFVKENDRLRKEIETMKKNNMILRKQLKWNEDDSYHVQEQKMSFGQLQVYTSHVETTRALFEDYAIEKNSEWINLSSLPLLTNKLGDVSSEKEQKELEVLLESNPEGFKDKINFKQFLKWWVNRMNENNDDDVSRFKIMNNKTKNGNFKISRIRRRRIGKKGTLSYRIRFYYKDKESFNEKPISPWHDIPLFNVGKERKSQFLLNFVCEVPKWTRAKLEVTPREKYNPIRQQMKFGKIRDYVHGDMMFNYGMFPQTWEDPRNIDKDTGFKGDNRPLNGIEVGTRQCESGECLCVKVLGVLGLIDEGKTDYKILCINITDPLANKLQDVEDLETFIPGCVSAIREYFRIYKVPHNIPPNEYVFGEMPKNKEHAMKVIRKSNESWKKLLKEFEDGVVPNTPGNLITMKELDNKFDVKSKTEQQNKKQQVLDVPSNNIN